MEIITYQYGPYEFNVSKDDAGVLWFMAKPACDILEYINFRDAVKRHCRSKGVVIHDSLTPGGVQGVLYIDEGNLYRLMIKSNKPNARKFESWVCDEVLPSIRKTGKYEKGTSKSAEQSRLEEAADRYDSLERVFRKTNGIVKRMGYRGNAAVLETCSRVEAETGIDCIRLFRAEHLFRQPSGMGTEEPQFNYEEFRDFIGECCVVDEGARVGASVLYARFIDWWGESMHGRILPSQKVFGTFARGMFRSTKQGIFIYFGLRLKVADYQNGLSCIS